MSPQVCAFCLVSRWELVFVYHQPPANENRFEELANHYYREYYRCQGCAHYQAFHKLDLSQIYTGSYSESLYAGDRMQTLFARINALPPERSDNLGRVNYVKAQAARQFGPDYQPRLLDVGSGLGVFPYRMQQLGWPTTGLDPDPRAAEHIRSQAGCEALVGDFLVAEPPENRDQLYELISFNKVLEHVPDPINMLARARRWLTPEGITYVELPDGEAAALDPDGGGREEFAVEHYHAFSAASFTLLLQRAGFRLEQLERLREPSGKYTLRGYATLTPTKESCP